MGSDLVLISSFLFSDAALKERIQFQRYMNLNRERYFRNCIKNTYTRLHVICTILRCCSMGGAHDAVTGTSETKFKIHYLSYITCRMKINKG